jgi:hypothetical protein
MRKQICYHCKFLVRIERDKAWRDMTPWQILLPVCCNHPDSPGVVREMHPGYPACRNFRPRIERAEPLQPADPNIRYIPLTRGLYAIVDAADYEWLSKYKWFALDGHRGKFYAGRKHGRTILQMHRAIMKPPRGMVVHHINGNGLDNRRCNLLICTAEQNSRSRQPASTASGFIGVYPYGKRWRALIQRRGEALYEAVFNDKVEAALARDRKAIEFFGVAACLNFPNLNGAEDPQRASRIERYIDCRGFITACTSAGATLSRAARKRRSRASR